MSTTHRFLIAFVAAFGLATAGTAGAYHTLFVNQNPLVRTPQTP